MQIACPQCSAQYDLDPRLLPPSGASVQCTQCRCVFTAMPSGEALIPGQGQKPQPSRSSVGTTTQVFGSPYAASKQGAPNTQTTQIFGALPPKGRGAASPPQDDASEKTPAFGSPMAPPGEVEADRTPVSGSPAVRKPFAPGGKTQVFGALDAGVKAPSPSTTQAFGAASVPPPPPSASTTQVFGSASVSAKAASPSTTQVFGAASVPPQPSASTTLVFGSTSVGAKAPSPTTTQVFGAVSASSPPPTPATTQTFGSSEVQAARKAAQGAAQTPGKDHGPVPWLVEPGPAADPSRSITAERPASGAPAPSVELPEDPVPLPSPAFPAFPPESPVERSGPISASRRTPSVELPPELIVPDRSEKVRSASEQESGSGRERILIVLAAVVALGLTAWLSYPVWRNRGTELPADALTSKDEAVSLLRRDDATSRAQAIERLNLLAEQYPKFTEAQSELVVALAMQLDDVNVELEWIHLEEERIQKEISQLELAKATADWSSRVNARKQDLNLLGEQRRPLDTTVSKLTKRLEQAHDVIRAAPETEPSSDVVARVKAQAVYASVNGSAEAIALAERLRKVESYPQWSVLVSAEYGLNAHSPAASLQDISDALAQVREHDQTFLRAYVLGARLALRQQEPAKARTLLDAVLLLNPNHALARTLQKQAAATSPAP